jgi:NAD(P)-dependent dehydrogenase (short-subunit alcohol dehydrogenase family)
MYTTSSIAPVFVVHRLVKAGLLKEGSKIVLVSSEAGSIGLRHEKEGGGNYAHHASKAALNMVGKLLSLDLKGDGVIVSIIHPGFMRTEMTAGVGFDQYWDSGGGKPFLSVCAHRKLTPFHDSCNTRRGCVDPNRVDGQAGQDQVRGVLGPQRAK